METPSWETLKSQWQQLVADKRRRILLIIGAVLLLFGLVYRLYPVYDGLMGGETDIADRQKRVAKYRQVVSGKDALEARIVSLESSLEQAEAGLLTGKTEALAAVDIQNTLNEIALASGVEIQSMQVLKSDNQKQEGNLYINVPVQLSVTLTMRQLKDMLYKIEACPKFFLAVQWIRMNTAGARDSGNIRCDMAVAGIMKNPEE